MLRHAAVVGESCPSTRRDDLPRRTRARCTSLECARCAASPGDAAPGGCRSSAPAATLDPVDSLRGKLDEGALDVLLSADLPLGDFDPQGAAGVAHQFCNDDVGLVARVEHQSNAGSLAVQQLFQQLKALLCHVGVARCRAREVAAGLRETVDESGSDGVGDNGKDNGNVLRGIAGGNRRGRRRRKDHVDAETHQLGRQRRKLAKIAIRRSIDQIQVVALHVACRSQTLLERLVASRKDLRRHAFQDADPEGVVEAR